MQPVQTIPEKGLSINWPVAGTYFGYPGCRLRIDLAFSEEFLGRVPLEIALISKADGKVVAACHNEYVELAGCIYDFGGELQLPDELAEGEYSLRVTSVGCKQTVDIVLKQSESPLEVYDQMIRRGT